MKYMERRVSVLIPYRTQNEEYRTRNLKAVTDRWCYYIDHRVRYEWLDQWTDYEIVIGRNDDEPFNRGAARNDAFKRSKGSVVILCDADTLFLNDDAIDSAVECTRVHPWVIPYGKYYNATKSWTDGYLAQKAEPYAMGIDGSYDHCFLDERTCGLIVMRREAFSIVGGYDERFQGWGYEDNAFASACEGMFRKPHRLSSFDVVHLWHPRGQDFNQPGIDRNCDLFVEVREAAKDIGTMKDYLRERGPYV